MYIDAQKAKTYRLEVPSPKLKPSKKVIESPQNKMIETKITLNEDSDDNSPA